MVPDPRVLDGGARLAVAEEMARVLLCVLQKNTMCVTAPTADEKAHRVHQRQRTASDLLQILSDRHVLPIPGLRATNPVRLAELEFFDLFELRLFIRGLLDVGVLAFVPRRP